MNDNWILRSDLRMEAGSKEAEILVYGTLISGRSFWDEEDSGMTAKEMDSAIKQAKKDGADKLTVRINSPGGQVYQGIAMRNMLVNAAKDMDLYVVIEGMCASAATLLLCVPGVKGVSIAKGSEVMIHCPASYVYGNASAMEKEADSLRKTQKSVSEIYAERTGKTPEEMNELMEAETWYTAEETVEAGFADELIGETAVAACVDPESFAVMKAAYKRVPDNVVSNAKPDTAGETTENKNSEQEQEEMMDIKDITMDALREQNMELYNSIMQAGAEAERERISDIHDLTPAGCEQMEADAVKNGTSSADYCKMVVRAEREKKAGYLEQRQQETEPAMNVSAGAAEDGKRNEQDEVDKNAKEMAELAKTYAGGTASMH